jgi:hypothetical protein
VLQGFLCKSSCSGVALTLSLRKGCMLWPSIDAWWTAPCSVFSTEVFFCLENKNLQTLLGFLYRQLFKILRSYFLNFIRILKKNPLYFNVENLQGNTAWRQENSYADLKVSIFWHFTVKHDCHRFLKGVTTFRKSCPLNFQEQKESSYFTKISIFTNMLLNFQPYEIFIW